MKNTIAGASLIIASSVCVLALALIDYRPGSQHGGVALFPLAGIVYFGLGLYLLFFAKEKP